MPSDSLGSEDLAGDGLCRALSDMRLAYASQPAPSVKVRVNRLDRLKQAIYAYKDQLIEAVNADFSGRATAETLLMELIPVLEGIHYYQKKMRKLMKPSRRQTPLILLGATTRVQYQPLGVVGIVVPWNFPIFLGLSPLVGAIAAGNRAMIKTSEFAPRTGALIQRMLAEFFDPTEVAVFAGGVDVATAFTKLPFDHLVFTGSTTVGKHVMAAAAETLTPVTLELGGKSPAIIHDSFPIDVAAQRIAFGKGINAGQVCVSPDYVMVPRSEVSAFVKAFRNVFEERYATSVQNADYTAIISTRQKKRLEGLLNDAKEKGATVIPLQSDDSVGEANRKLPMHLITDVTEEMGILQEEIFGPLLPIIPYDTLEDAIDYVSRKERPLALYYFDWNKERFSKVVRETHSGGACHNDVMSQVIVDDMPFGGIGPSGIGHYHGEEGFRRFSHAKSILQKGRFNSSAFVAPPWGRWAYQLVVAFQLWRLK